jgi:hypothetical protein
MDRRVAAIVAVSGNLQEQPFDCVMSRRIQSVRGARLSTFVEHGEYRNEQLFNARLNYYL